MTTDDFDRDAGTVDDRPAGRTILFSSSTRVAPKVSAVSPPAPPARRTQLKSSSRLRTASEVGLELAAPESPEPPVVIDAPAPPLESEVILLASCSGGDLPLARAVMTTRTEARLARLRTLVADSAAQIDADLAAGRALIEGAAQAIVDGTEAVNDLASALATRAGFLRDVAADSAELVADQAKLDEHALELTGEELAYLNARIEALPDRIAANQAAADAAVPGIRSMITDGGVDLVGLVAEIYSATDRIPGGSFFANQRVTRSDVEAGRYEIPPE
jgi:hypothetical protein